jgi:hypothetical protein
MFAGNMIFCFIKKLTALTRFILYVLALMFIGCKSLKHHPYDFSEVCSNEKVEDGYYIVKLKYLDGNKSNITALSNDDNNSKAWIKVVGNVPELEQTFYRPKSITVDGQHLNGQIDRIKYVEVEGCEKWVFEFNIQAEDMKDEVRYYQNQ